MADILTMGWPFACVCIAAILACVVVYAIRRGSD